MLALDRARTRDMVRGSALALLMILAVVAVDEADASPKPGKSRKPAETPLPNIGAGTTPVRFFTINEVLAKQGVRDSRMPVRVASASPPSGAPDVTTGAATRHTPSKEPFGLHAFRAPDGLLSVKWRGVEAQMREEAKLIAQCRADPEQCASAAARRLNAIADEAGARSGRARIEAVNRAINAAIKYTSDASQHGTADRWSAPLASLASGRGDCEDYAIAKYAALRAAGVADDDLQLLLVKDRKVQQDHAVLAVRSDAKWLVLDNRHTTLNETTELAHLTPLFGLNSKGVRLFAAPYVSAGMAAGN